MERAVQMMKDRTESFDECILEHIWRWLNLFHLSTQPETSPLIKSIKRSDKNVSS
ncbi:MAG: hypothetical protein QXV23_02340 [Candidatus Bathyarchaeia archaeon]